MILHLFRMLDGDKRNLISYHFRISDAVKKNDILASTEHFCFTTELCKK